MGGYGSGRYGFSVTAKLDEGLKLDLAVLKRQGMLALGVRQSGNLTWSRSGTGEVISSISHEVNTLNPDYMWMRVHYLYGSDKSEKMDYKIMLTTTQPHYGGRRLWFVCPVTGARSSVLYLLSGNNRFASRHACKLKYRSQSSSPSDRAIDKMWKLKNKLGGEDYLDRPKGMHEKTHMRMMREIWDAEEVVGFYMRKRLYSLFGKFVQ